MSLELESHALLLKRTDYRDSDLIVTLFTRGSGRLQALARGARRSQKRFAGALEPLHTLSVELVSSTRSTMYELKAASIAAPRFQVAENLDRLQAAGRVLGWIRQSVPEKSIDPDLWQLVIGTMDALDRKDVDSTTTVAEFGLRLLAVLGWGVDFDHCVKCGAPCPANKSATVSATQGGLVCARCGGAKTRLHAELRTHLSNVGNGHDSLVSEHAAIALRLAEEALAAHADLT